MYRDGMEVVGENMDMDGIGVLPLILLLRGGGRTSTRIGTGIDGGTHRAEVMATETALGGKTIVIVIEILFKNEVSIVNSTNQDQENIQAENLFEECLPETNGTNLAILLIEVVES
jgi:hypothetical protein